MAVTFRTSAVGGNTTTGTSPSATLTPVVGDLFLVFCQAAGNTNAVPTCSDGNGGTYTLLFAEGSNTNANYLSCFIRTSLLANTTLTVVTVATGAHSAAEVCVVALSGAATAGAAAVIQSGVQANQAGSTKPSPALSAVAWGDLVLSAVGNATNPGGVSVSANAAPWTWNRAQDAGQTGCGLDVEYSTGGGDALPSGVVAWGSNSASVFASCAVEIGSAAPHAGVNAGKLTAYGVLAPPPGVEVSKLTAYGVLAPPPGVEVSKLIAYAVLNAINTNAPSWPGITPPYGYLSNTYNATWDLTSAAAPTTYTLASGSLPPGLTLNNVAGGDGNLGSITGTPTVTGSYSFVLTATNTYGSANLSMTITITMASGGGGAFTWTG
jgi:hypothetical protein